MIIAIFAGLSTIMTVLFTSCFFYIFPDMFFGVIILILLATFYSIFLFSYFYIMDYIER